MKLLDQVVPPAGGEYARALSPRPLPGSAAHQACARPLSPNPSCGAQRPDWSEGEGARPLTNTDTGCQVGNLVQFCISQISRERPLSAQGLAELPRRLGKVQPFP